MEMGQDTLGRPSWVERMVSLRDGEDLGPFRLAFLEALIRAADVRASEDPGSEGVDYD
jgi:CRISPR-associated endonuclease/helicase Cas3